MNIHWIIVHVHSSDSYFLYVTQSLALFSASFTMPQNVEMKEIIESCPSGASALPQQKPEKTANVRIDGGIVAWLQVLGAFSLSFTAW